MKIVFRLPLLVVLLAFISLSASAQCTQKIADLTAAQVLLGFQLGMTKEQVKALVPQIKFGRTDPFGVSKTTINPFFDPKIDKSRFADVRSVSLDFVDERLTSIWIGFEESYQINDIAEFAKALSASLRLPNAWTPWKGRGQQMLCAGFQLTVTTVARAPSFRLLDITAEDTVAARRAAKEELDSAAEAAGVNGSSEDTSVTADKKNRTYFPSGCDAAKEVSAGNRLIFKNAEEAQKAGFKIAKGCQ